MILVGVSSLVPPPTWNSENEHGWQVCHCASDAAIFIGWYLVTTTPSSLPMNMASRAPGISTASESLAVRLNRSASERRSRCQADTASITVAPVTSDASTTWVYAQRKTGLPSTAQKLVSSALP